MKEFFNSQMDYIFFIYGLAFFLLFFVCLYLQKQDRSSIRWSFLGLFGLVHGINEWLDLIVNTFGDSDPFKWTRLVILTLSFVFLFEFGRSTCERLKYLRIGRWVYLPFLLVFILSISSGVFVMNGVVRNSLGFIGSFWSAIALWRISKDNKDSTWDMSLAAMAMAVYGIAAGVLINNNSFLQMAGFPVQLLRGFLACLFTGTIWRYYERIRVVDLGPQLVNKELKFGATVVVILNLILVIGWLWVVQLGQNEDLEQKSKLSSFSQQVFESLDMDLVKGLNGSLTDLNNPNYLILKNELQQIRDTILPVRFIYLMRKINEKIVFLVDSEPSGSKDESPPGQIYNEASPNLKHVFVSGGMSIFDQYTDRWGTWVSAFTPINDERTGGLIGVLGIDEDAHNYNFYNKFERLKGIVLIGIICLSVLLVFIYWHRFIVRLQDPKVVNDTDFFIHWGVVAIVGGVGIVLTIFLFLELRNDAWDLFQTTFQQRAKTRIESVYQEVERQLDRLSGLCLFMGSNDSMDRGSFDQYVGPFLKDVPVHAFAWVPRVKSDDLLFYESSARQDGIDGYKVYDKFVQGKRMLEQKRDEYFPVYYVQPMQGNDIALGFNMTSEPVRRAAMEKSRDTGQPVLTPPLVLMQAMHDRFGFLIFIPVYAKDLPRYTVVQRRNSLRGFILGVYSAQEFLKNTYSKMPPEGLACLIEDPSASVDRKVFYRHKIRIGTVDWTNPLLKHVDYLRVADRQWRVTIIPGTEFINRNLSRIYWWALIIGFFMTSLVAVFLNFLATARYRAEKLVKLRTSELIKEKESLKKREEDFHLILDSTAEAIYGVDMSGDCSFCNPSCLRMLGYDDKKDLLGKNMHLLIHHTRPDGTPFPVEQCQLFNAFKNNLKIHVEEVFWRKDGTSFFAEVWSYPEVRNGKVLGAVISFLDITERKIAEETLQKREAYLTSILDNFPFMVWLKDSFGRFLAVNQVFAKAYGHSVSEIVGKTDFDFGSRELAEKYNADDIKVMLGRKTVVLEEPILNGDKEGYFETYKSPIFNNDGLVIGTVGFARDITERKKAEEALRESEERYRKITSSITDYIYHVYIENDKPVSTTYSPGCRRVTGYSPEEFLSNPSLWIQIVLDEDRHIVERQIEDIFKGKINEAVEHRIRHKDGHICWVSNTIVCQFDAYGKLVGYDGLIANITERKRVEEALNSAKETAEQALAIKDEFTSTVSHELRTPLAAIKSSIDILDTEAPGALTSDQKTFIKRVKSNIDRLARLINDVLDLSKLEAGKMVMNLMPLRAESVVQEVVDSQEPLVKAKGLKISIEFGQGLPTLIADKDRLIQVLNNLINNALKFTKEGGIVVSVHSEDRQNLTFGISDTGVGIKDEDLTKLFQKFQQVGGASQQVGGTGLGLAICKLIIDKHKGRIWVESQYGSGSTFKFSLPVRKEKRILIVDDDETTLEVLRNFLEIQDMYEIEMASDGFRAGQKYYDFSPQLIILDINLPKVNGLEMCSRIKNDPKTRHTKIIILSSFNSEQRKKEAWDAGADELLNKPINLEELIAKVRKLI